MIPIHELLNKIKWDTNERPEAYSLLYYDRIKNELVGFRYADIEEIEDGFIKLMQDQKLVSIPFHRIKQVKKEGKMVWERSKFL